MTFRIPIVTVSEANQREHWARKHKRKVSQQDAVALLMNGSQRRLRALARPVVVTLTRLYPAPDGKRLDKDNLAGSFKHVQDQVAYLLGVDDGDEAVVDWLYRQEPARSYGIVVALAGAAATEASHG